MEAIELPDSLTTIEVCAFVGCSSLKNIEIPDSVTSMGGATIYNCSSLEKVKLPGGLTTLNGHYSGNYIFEGCNSLQEIIFPDNIKTITNLGNVNSSTQYICSAGTITATALTEYGKNITSPTAPDFRYRQSEDANGVRTLTIVSYAGNSLNVSIPASIDGVPVKTIRGLRGAITRVEIPEGIESIDSYAFYQCAKLTEIEIGSTVTSIGQYAFDGCTALESITLPEGLTNLSNDNIFNGCTALKSIVFPNNLTAISTNAIPSASSVQYVCRAGTTTATTLTNRGTGVNLMSASCPDYRWRQEVDGDGNINLLISAYKGTEKRIEVPAFIDNCAVTAIKNQCFMNNATLEKVTLPDTLITIGASAFSGCSALQTVILPDYLASIGDFAFQKCPKLNGVILPAWLESLGVGAFYNCTGLTSINIPGGIVEIPDRPSTSSYGVFQGCTSLNGVAFSEGLTKIGSYAFYGCNELEQITLPSSLTSIGANAFYSTTAGTLKRLMVPSGVSTFGSNITNGRLTVYCYENTPGYNWAMGAGHTVVLLDGGVNDRLFYLPEDFRLIRGESQLVIAQVFPVLEDDVITWTSSDPSIATVSDGVVTAVSKGTVTITATMGEMSDSLVVTCYVPLDSFELSHEDLYIVQQSVFPLTVVNMVPADADTTFTWSSSNTTYVAVDQTGKVTGKRPGNARITVVSDTNIERECTVHVCYPVTLIEFNQEIYECAIGSEVQLEAAVTASNQTYVNKLVTFSSSDETIASVDEDGKVTAHAYGEAVITATAQNGVHASCKVRTSCSEHVPVTDAGTPATCTEEGLSDGSHCEVCGTVIQEQEVIPALGHEWGETTYAWSSDNTKVTASHICIHDDTHKEEETVTTTFELAQSPTATEKGKTSFTATFTNTSFAIQTKTAEDIPSLNSMSLLALPAQLTTIEEEAFAELPCEGVIIPDGCTTIGQRAFADCDHLIYIRIPASVTDIAEDAFDGCEWVRIDRN